MKYFQRKLEAIEAAKAQEKEGQQMGALQGTMGGSLKEQGASGNMGGALAQGRVGQGGFAAKNESFGRTMQGDDPNRRIMREDYGWKMTDADYGAVEKQTGDFNKQLGKYKSDYNKQIAKYKTATEGQIASETKRYEGFKQKFQKTYDSAKNQFASAEKEWDAAKKKLGGLPTKSKMFDDWYKKDKMQVGVMDESGKIQGTYWVPRTIAKKQIIGKMDGAWDTTTKNPGQRFLVSVKQGGRMRGQEVHDSLRENFTRDKVKEAFWKEPDIQGAYRKSIGQWDAANQKLQSAHTKLSSQKSQWLKTVAQDDKALSDFNYNIKSSKEKLKYQVQSEGIKRDTQIGNARNARQGKIDAARKAYETRASAARKSYQNISKMRTDGSNAKGNK